MSPASVGFLWSICVYGFLSVFCLAKKKGGETGLTSLVLLLLRRVLVETGQGSLFDLLKASNPSLSFLYAPCLFFFVQSSSASCLVSSLLSLRQIS